METLIDLTGKNQEALAGVVKKEELKEEPAEELRELTNEESTEELLGAQDEQLKGVKRKRHRKNKRQRELAKARSPDERSKNTFDEAESPPYHENVFETSNNEDKNAWREWERYLSRQGKLTREYLNGMLMDTQKHYDLKFGPRCDDDKMQFRMGDTPIYFDIEDYIHVGGEEGYAEGAMYHGTRGLYELIFKKDPDKRLYNDQDLRVYKDILQLTNAHMQKYDPQLRLASSSSLKYNKIISPLFMKKGGALLPVTGNPIEYVHWDDPNELVGRLALLIASREAGNNGHEAEIASIQQELKKGNYIE